MTDTPHTPRGELTLRDESGAVRRVEFRGRALIGRDPSCTVVLPSGTVSRHHAVLEYDEDGWHVRDLNSGNGTQVNRKGVLTSAVAPGDELIFGELAARFENLPDEEPSRLETTARLLTQTLRVKPVKKARPVAAVAVTAMSVGLLLGATLFARGCPTQRAGESAGAPSDAR